MKDPIIGMGTKIQMKDQATGKWHDVNMLNWGIDRSSEKDRSALAVLNLPESYGDWMRSLSYAPDLGELLRRYQHVCRAIEVCRQLGLNPLPCWLVEAGVHELINPCFLDP